MSRSNSDLSVSSEVPPGLPELRAQLDAIDRNIIDLLARRIDVCRAVARAKEKTNARIIAPVRVHEVWNSRRRWAAAVGLDPDFCEQMFRTLLAETHRIESAEADGGRERHDTPAEIGYDSALQLSACRLDHATLAVPDVAAAESFLVTKLGFRRDPVTTENKATRPCVTLQAGGVTVLLLHDDGAVPGVHHLAIEVLDALHARDDLAARGCEVSEIRADAQGIEEFFVAVDPSTGLRVGVLSRTGSRSAPDGTLAASTMQR